MQSLRSEKGQSIVETAIALPIVLMIILSVISFSIIMNSKIVVNDAARQAARTLAINGDATQAKNAFQKALKDGGVAATENVNYKVIRTKTSGNEVEFEVIYYQKALVPWVDRMLWGVDERVRGYTPPSGTVAFYIKAVSKKE